MNKIRLLLPDCILTKELPKTDAVTNDTGILATSLLCTSRLRDMFARNDRLEPRTALVVENTIVMAQKE